MTEAKALFNLYQSSRFNKLWPVTFIDFQTKLFNEDQDIKTQTISRDGGFLVLKMKEDQGSIICLVTNDNEPHSLVIELLEEAITKSRDLGVRSLHFGHKVGSYMWPGLPEQPDLKSIFFELGFVDSWGYPAEDLLLDLSEKLDFSDLYKNIPQKDYRTRNAIANDIQALIEFETREFPNWVKHYQSVINKMEMERILLVENSDHEIVAASILGRDDYLFRSLLPGMTGGAGVVGVASKLRGKGIGTMMQIESIRILKRMGVRFAVVEYTGASEFYKRIGYKEWKKYYMLKKLL